MTSKPKILDEIMFYILERANCEKEKDKYLQHVLNYCIKDYQQSYKKQNGSELTKNEIQQKLKIKATNN